MKKAWCAFYFAIAIDCTAVAVDKQNLDWNQSAFPQSVMEFARHTDIRDPEAVSKALNVQTDLRSYCAYSNCEGREVIGLMHAYPDQAVYLPGPEKIKMQYFVSWENFSFENNWPAINTLAALDMFVPKTDYCIKRSDVRAVLGKETYSGAPLNRGEPLEVGLVYQAFRDATYRTLAEFVFKGSPAENGCLAFASIRADDYFTGRDEKTEQQQKTYYHGRDIPYHYEWSVDLEGPRSIFDPDAVTLPLGMDIDKVLKEHPECEKLFHGVATEDYRTLTQMPKDGIALLPSYQGSWLASSESVWNTDQHSSHKRPVLDAEQFSLYRLHCYEHPHVDDGGDHTTTIQEYDLLIFEGKVLAVNELVAGQHMILPARFMVSEALAELPAETQSIYVWPDGGYRVNGYARNRKYLAFINIIGLTRHEKNYGLSFGESGFLRFAPSADFIYIDAEAWQRYSQNVMDKVKAIQSSEYKGFEEYCTLDTCFWPPVPHELPLPSKDTLAAGAPPPTPSVKWHAHDVIDVREAPSGAPLVKAVQRFLAGEDLLDYAGFGKALGTESVLLQKGHSQDKIDFDAQDGYTVGLKPSDKMLALPSFTYDILFPKEPNGLPHPEYLSSYHEKIADIEIGLDPIFRKGGERNLATTYCITRDDAVKAFGPDTGKPNGGDLAFYAHKFDYDSTKGYDIFVKLVFAGGLQGVGVVEFKCARTLSLTQYRFHKMQ